MRKHKVIIVPIVVLFALLLLKDMLAKSAVTLVAQDLTGAAVRISGFSLGIFRHSVSITGLRVYNPKGFPKGIMLDMPKIKVDYNLADLLKGKIHLAKAELRLKELSLIRNNRGVLNVDSLKVSGREEITTEKPKKETQFKIDELKLGIGRIVHKDYSADSQEPVVLVHDINLDKTYKNITGIRQLTLLILVEPMKAAAIEGTVVYGVSALAGVAALPVAVAAKFVGKDYAQAPFKANPQYLYDLSLQVVKRIGKVTKENAAERIIAAGVYGADIELKIKKISDNTSQILISARRYLLPKPEIAAGILYQIQEELK